jgi:hypothetical protein
VAQLKEHRDAVRRIIARAWADPDFKANLINDTKRCLEEGGVSCDSRRWEVVEGSEPRKSTEDVAFFHLPPSPFSTDAVTDEQLLNIETLAACTAHASQCPSPMTTCCCDITVAPSLFV